jgi:hypothetical protein
VFYIVIKHSYSFIKHYIIYINDTEFFSDVLFQYPAIVPGVLSVCIRSETVATLLSKHFECLHENRDKSCILQPRKLYEPLFLRLCLRYQIKIHETENIFRKFYREATASF